MRSVHVPKWLILVGLLLLPFPCRALAQEEGAVITRIDLRTRYDSPPAETFLPLIPLKEGDRTTVDRVRAVEETLKRSGLFRSVSVQVDEGPEGISMLFDLCQLERVSRVRIKGNWLVLSSAIYRVLAMQQGDPFREDALPGEVALITSLYERKGWHNTEVIPSFEQDPDDGSVSITYRIKRGHHIRFGPIELDGVEHGDPAEIIRILRIWPWVTGKRLNRRVDRVRDYYARIGYPVTRVEIKGLEPGESRKRPLLRVGIREGKRLVMEVKGNEVLPSSRILKATTFFENRGYGLFDAEDSAEAIRHLYEGEGYPNAVVTFKRKDVEEEVSVLFTIDEGEKGFIRKIAFEGNTAFRDRELSKHVFTRARQPLLFRRGAFVTEKWRKDRDGLINLYMSKGFLDVGVEHSLVPLEKREDRSVLLVKIKEGAQYTIASSTVLGASAEVEPALRQVLLLQAGEPFHEGKLVREAGRIAEFYAQRGYLLALVETDHQVREDRTVDISFRITEGPCYRLSGLIVSGNRKTRSRTIANALRLPEGDPISREELSDTRRRLHRLGTFEGLSVRVPGLDPTGQTKKEKEEGGQEEEKEEVSLPVLIEVKERKSLGAEVGISFDTDWGFEGLLSLREENLFGRAKKLTLDVVGGDERTEARLGFADPTIFGQRATATTRLSYDRREWTSYSEQRIEFEGGVFRQLRIFQKLQSVYSPGLFLLFDWATVYDVVSDAPDAPEPSDTFNLFVRPQIVRDTRRNMLYPTDGDYGELRFAVSNEAWASDDNLMISGFKWQDYYTFKPGVTIASRLWLDHVEPYGGTDEVPTTYLLFCGGNNSVRGFPRDGLGPRDLNGVPRGGTTRIIGNAEVRFPIYRLIHGVAFVDVGSLTDGFSDIEWDTFRWSTGGGLRLHTPVGPVRLEYGYQLQENPPLGRGELHFSLGFPF
jgi:outer membrane protein insertion porin family